MKRFALLCLLLLTPVLALAAKVYRWVDAGGQVHYSQIPPSSGKFDAVQTGRESPIAAAEEDSETGAANAEDEDGEEATAPPARPPAPVPAPVDETAKFLREAEAANKAEAEAKAKAKEERTKSEKKCTDARARLAYLDERTPRRLATTNPDGSYSRMDEGEFEKRKAAAQKEIDSNCR